MKHLNVVKAEISQINVNFEVNKFVAYVQLLDGSNVVFAHAYKWRDMLNNAEYAKYKNEWKIQVVCSQSALVQRTKQI